MRILIVAATEAELMPLHSALMPNEQLSIEMLITGVGLLSSGLSLMRKCYALQPDLAILTGIAGSFDDELTTGNAVVIRNEQIGDLGVEESGSFHNIFKMGLSNPDSFPFQRGVLTNPHDILCNRTALKLVDAVSVNEISTDPVRINYYRDQLGVSVESMEGAAFHQVCLEMNIPFVQIRGISNSVGDRNKSHWKIQEAIYSSTNAVITLISQSIR
ncbi:MAG: futalosine hydrolase [Chitinophagia bacterium]|jgi:futalosine hydrolase